MNNIAKSNNLPQSLEAGTWDNLQTCFFYQGKNPSEIDIDKIQRFGKGLSDVCFVSKIGLLFDLNCKARNIINIEEIMLLFCLSNNQLLLVLEHAVVKYVFANGFEMQNFIYLIQKDWIIADQHTFLNAAFLCDIEKLNEKELLVAFKNQMVLKFKQIKIPASFLKPSNSQNRRLKSNKGPKFEM